MTHQVGSGGSGAEETTERPWWILWGLVELNDVDSHEMAGDASHYTVQTERTVLDVVANPFTTWAAICSCEVTVTQ